MGRGHKQIRYKSFKTLARLKSICS